MMIIYDANGIPTIRDTEGNATGAGSGAQPVPFIHKGQPLQVTEAQSQDEEGAEEESRKEGGLRQSRRR